MSRAIVTRDMVQAAAVALRDWVEEGYEHLPSAQMQELCRTLANENDEDASWELVPVNDRPKRWYCLLHKDTVLPGSQISAGCDIYELVPTKEE